MARGARQLCLRLLETNLVLDPSLQIPLTCWCPCRTALYHTTQGHGLRSYMRLRWQRCLGLSFSQLAELSYFRESLYNCLESVKKSRILGVEYGGWWSGTRE